ncbi:MAG TPA: XOO1806 family protein [Xylella taiwanensis]
MVALAATLGAHAQSTVPSHSINSTILPILDKGSGKIEALLYLEPAGEQKIGTRWNFNKNSLDTMFGLSPSSSLGLLCNNGSGISMLGLTTHCMLASLDETNANNSNHRIAATAMFNNSSTRFGLTFSTVRNILPTWLFGSSLTKVEQNNLTVFGQKSTGREGFVSIGGTYALARVVPLSNATADLAGQWDSKTLSIGGGYGSFSAHIIGRVVDAPGRRPEKLKGIGLGLTWRTPWSGHFSVGAENIISRGNNPFAPSNESSNDGTVPYVRYEQDL